MSEGAGMAGGYGANAARPPAHTPKQGGAVGGVGDKRRAFFNASIHLLKWMCAPHWPSLGRQVVLPPPPPPASRRPLAAAASVLGAAPRPSVLCHPTPLRSPCLHCARARVCSRRPCRVQAWGCLRLLGTCHDTDSPPFSPRAALLGMCMQRLRAAGCRPSLGGEDSQACCEKWNGRGQRSRSRRAMQCGAQQRCV